MRRQLAFALCLASVMPQVAATADEWVVDATWKPKPGDLAHVYSATGKPLLAAKDDYAYSQLIKVSIANDDDGLMELADAGRVFVVYPGTEVLVIEPHSNGLLNRGYDLLEVRFKGGEHKGQVGWMLAKEVARLTRKTSPPPPKETQEEAEKRKAVEKLVADTAAAAKKEKARAEAAYKEARRLEVAGKTKEAIAAYRKIIKEFTSGHMETKAAAIRIKVLGGK